MKRQSIIELTFLLIIGHFWLFLFLQLQLSQQQTSCYILLLSYFLRMRFRKVISSDRVLCKTDHYCTLPPPLQNSI